MNSWKLKEIIMMSALSVVFAIVYLIFLHIGISLSSLLTPFGYGPMGYELVFGIWFIVSIIAAYIIRKPGVAVLSETIAAAVEVLLGNMVGPQLILSGLIQGLGAEAVFAATRYRNFSTWILVLAGMMCSVFSFVWGFFVSGFAAIAPGMLAFMLLVRLISGAVLAGLLGKWIADRLAATGVLRGYALGKEWRLKRHDGDREATV